LGGDASFRRFCAPYLLTSSEVYGALSSIRSEYDERRTPPPGREEGR
jgi:hypothetical protein